MAEYDQAWMLAQFLKITNLPASRSTPTDPEVYQYVTDGCRRVQRLIAQHVPAALRQGPVQLTTTDDGATYVFPSFPFGHVVLREGNCGDVLLPGTFWDQSGETYILEGNTVRWPNNATRTFAEGLWALYVPQHGVVNATTAPTLIAPALRAALYDAAAEWASDGGALDPEPYERRRARELWGNPSEGETGLIHALKTQQFGQGLPAILPADSYWWRTPGWVGGV